MKSTKKQLAFIFPGQGTQKCGMAKDIFDKYSTFRDLFFECKKQNGIDLEELIFTENDDLNQTQFTQVAILAVELGVLRILNQNNIQPICTAGYSLGEYGALVASKSLDELKALALVKERGKLMATTVANGVGGMAAVIGLAEDKIQEVISSYKSLEIVNYNTSTQVSIAGLKTEVESAVKPLQDAGARRVVVLNVSGPFHSALLAKAGDKFAEFLNDVQIKKPDIPYYPNKIGVLKSDDSGIKELLCDQIHSPVLWRQSMENMLSEMSLDAIVEVGPGSTLRGFLRNVSNCPETCGTNTVQELEETIEKLKG